MGRTQLPEKVLSVHNSDMKETVYQEDEERLFQKDEIGLLWTPQKTKEINGAGK